MAGVRIPQDVSIAGVGGVDETMSPARRLTTAVHQFTLVLSSDKLDVTKQDTAAGPSPQCHKSNQREIPQ